MFQVTFKTPSPTKEPGTLHFNKKHSNSKVDDQKSAKNDETKKEKKLNHQPRDWNNLRNASKDTSAEGEKTDSIVAQQKLIEVLNARTGKKSNKVEAESGKDLKKREKGKDNPFPEFMSAFPPLPSVKDGTKNSGPRLADGYRVRVKFKC